jgi:ABC-type transporter Mla subunit MlaD
MTSITGVFISLALSTLFRRLVRTLQMRFERLCTALEKRLEYVSSASLADEQLQELSRQTLQLERFNTDFAVELAGVLDDRLNRTLAASLTQAVEPVVSAVNNLSGNMGSMSQGAIETMVKDFQTGLKQSTGDELGSVVGALGQVRETLEHAAAGLQANGADFGSRLDKVAEQMEQRLGTAVQGMGDNLTQTAGELDRVLRELSERMRSDALGASAGLSAAMTTAGERTLAALNEAGSAFSAEVRSTAAGFAEALGKSLAILPNFEQTLKTLDARFARQVDAFDASTEQLRTLVAELERGSRSLNAAASPIAATAGQFAAASQRIEAASSALRDTRQGFAQLNAELKDTFDANRRVWEEYRARFEQVDGHLEGVVRQLTEGTRAYHQEINGFVTNLDAQLAKAVNSFSGAVSELGEVTEGLEEQMRDANGGSRHDHGSRPARPS